MPEPGGYIRNMHKATHRILRLVVRLTLKLIARVEAVGFDIPLLLADLSSLPTTLVAWMLPSPTTSWTVPM